MEESALCLFCDQSRRNHDQMRCDAIRAALAARAKRMQEGTVGYRLALDQIRERKF